MSVTEDWVTREARTRFEPGMFVARVQGDSMAPEIPDGAYCLFRQPRTGSRQDRKLLVWHSGIADPQTGGQYTLKVYTSESAAVADGDWQHTRIVCADVLRVEAAIKEDGAPDRP